ncbi:MAG: twin-arginine translocation signal domain-containing protein [Armatimonadetes bacterium]|jgi:hypothetical protein|nr:twin-arginine translocation signal domain-containing protein [Armatimonadota bacterium]
MSRQITRRDFLKGAAATGAGLLILRDSRMAFGYPANETLNVAVIGASGKGDVNSICVPLPKRNRT